MNSFVHALVGDGNLKSQPRSLWVSLENRPSDSQEPTGHSAVHHRPQGEEKREKVREELPDEPRNTQQEREAQGSRAVKPKG